MDIESLNNTHVHYEESIEVGERPKPSRNFNSKFNDDEDSDFLSYAGPDGTSYSRTTKKKIRVSLPTTESMVKMRLRVSLRDRVVNLFCGHYPTRV